MCLSLFLPLLVDGHRCRSLYGCTDPQAVAGSYDDAEFSEDSGSGRTVAVSVYQVAELGLMLDTVAVSEYVLKVIFVHSLLLEIVSHIV